MPTPVDRAWKPPGGDDSQVDLTLCRSSPSIIRLPFWQVGRIPCKLFIFILFLKGKPGSAIRVTAIAYHGPRPDRNVRSRTRAIFVRFCGPGRGGVRTGSLNRPKIALAAPQDNERG